MCVGWLDGYMDLLMFDLDGCWMEDEWVNKVDRWMEIGNNLD